MYKHVTFIPLDAFTFQLVQSLFTWLQNMSDWSKQQKHEPFWKILSFVFFCLSSVSVFSCAGCIWTWMMLHYTVNWGVLRMSRLTLGRMSSVWGGWRTKSCKMYVMLFLTETSVSFTPNSVVKNCFSLSDRNVSFAVSAIHLDGHWTWKYEIRWYFGWKQPIFTMISFCK